MEMRRNLHLRFLYHQESSPYDIKNAPLNKKQDIYLQENRKKIYYREIKKKRKRKQFSQEGVDLNEKRISP